MSSLNEGIDGVIFSRLFVKKSASLYEKITWLLEEEIYFSWLNQHYTCMRTARNSP